MRINYLGRKPPDPLVQRDIQDFARLEELQKDQVSIARVFRVITSIEWSSCLSFSSFIAFSSSVNSTVFVLCTQEQARANTTSQCLQADSALYLL
jgi:hypothetical protein